MSQLGSGISDALFSQRKPLAATAPTSTGGLSAFGQTITPPPAPNLSGNLLQDQNAANKVNVQRYGQGLGVLSGGLNAGLGSISQAIDDSNTYGNAAKQKLNYQLQNDLGQQTQSAASRGLADTTIADTMKDLPQRRYNDATAQVDEMAANRRSGLELNQANMQNQGAFNIAQYIQSRNDNAPNAQFYASLAQKAASNPGRASLSTVNGGAGLPANFGASDFQKAQDSSLPNTSNGGGYGSANGGSGGYFTGAGNGVQQSGASDQGYTGGTMGGGDQNFSPSMAAGGLGQGQMSIAASGQPQGGPISSAIQPQSATLPTGQQPTAAPTPAPTSIASSMSAGPQNLYSQGAASMYAGYAKQSLPEWLKANNAGIA